MVNKDKIIHLIEKKRTELKELVREKRKFDENVVKKSQELDLLLNQFDDNSLAKKRA
ncbi:MAG: aspartyl-phosphate phosphatase Spo0E family protein [Halanaerobiales bacterium]